GVRLGREAEHQVELPGDPERPRRVRKAGHLAQRPLVPFDDVEPARLRATRRGVLEGEVGREVERRRRVRLPPRRAPPPPGARPPPRRRPSTRGTGSASGSAYAGSSSAGQTYGPPFTRTIVTPSTGAAGTGGVGSAATASINVGGVGGAGRRVAARLARDAT